MLDNTSTSWSVLYQASNLTGSLILPGLSFDSVIASLTLDQVPDYLQNTFNPYNDDGSIKTVFRIGYLQRLIHVTSLNLDILEAGRPCFLGNNLIDFSTTPVTNFKLVFVPNKRFPFYNFALYVDPGNMPLNSYGTQNTTKSSTATPTTVAITTTSAVALTANPNRLGLMINNLSTKSYIYVCTTATATAAAATMVIPPQAYEEWPAPIWQGQISVIASVAGSASVIFTEYTL
jgi:hypothetical protein